MLKKIVSDPKAKAEYFYDCPQMVLLAQMVSSYLNSKNALLRELGDDFSFVAGDLITTARTAPYDHARFLELSDELVESWRLRTSTSTSSTSSGTRSSSHRTAVASAPPRSDAADVASVSSASAVSTIISEEGSSTSRPPSRRHLMMLSML